jgi:hypothetical protein
MLGILIFYANFEEQSRMLGTFLLLCSVILFTPFLPDGKDLPEGQIIMKLRIRKAVKKNNLKKYKLFLQTESSI